MSRKITGSSRINRFTRQVTSTGLKTLATAALIAIGSSAAIAGPIGFSFAMNGNPNYPFLTLTNQSDTAQITGYTLTIGDTAFNFDAVVASSQGFTAGSGSFTLNSPDTNEFGGIRTELLSYSFTDFDPTEVFSSSVDLDLDGANNLTEYRDVFFNNGLADNSVLTVSFLDGGVAGDLSLTMEDGPDQTDYLLSASGFIDNAPVPEPGMLALFGIGLAGLGVMARRRAKRA